MIPSMELLHFSLWAINMFAWPIVALGYPLFASIRAVESGSSHHMKKLVMYWAICALLSLTEFAFENSFGWLPHYWSSVRFVVVYWLGIPEFEGASLAYERLVTPAVLKLQEAIDLYNKIKEERCSKRERFSDSVEKYIKENGFEALEKLIASKKQHEIEKCTDSVRDTKNVEPEGENTAAKSNRNQHEKQKSTDSPIDAKIIEVEGENTEVTSNKAYANSEKITPPEASTENRRPQTPLLEKTQPQWTCDLCNVTTTSESTLNAHLQGRNHKSNLESLKSSLLDAEDSASSSLRRSVQAARAEARRILLPKVTAEKRPQWYCDLCKVTTTSKENLNAHYRGSKHNSKLETILKEGKIDAKDNKGPSASATSGLSHGNAEEEFIEGSRSQLTQNKHRDVYVEESEEKNGSSASQQMQCNNAEVKAKPQQEWSFDSCKAKATSQSKYITGVLYGKKPSSMFIPRKTSNLRAEDTVPSSHWEQLGWGGA